jgi:hypothetical protein
MAAGNGPSAHLALRWGPTYESTQSFGFLAQPKLECNKSFLA